MQQCLWYLLQWTWICVVTFVNSHFFADEAQGLLLLNLTKKLKLKMYMQQTSMNLYELRS